MLRPLHSIACIILISLSAAVLGEVAKLPASVKKELSEMRTMCRGVGGKPTKSPKLVLIADLTGDGLPDYVIDQGAFGCKGAASLFSGSGGSQMLAFVGTADGQAVQAFSSGTFGVKVDNTSKPAELLVMVGGTLCGQKATLNMARTDHELCWRPVVWNDTNRKLEFAPVSRVQPLQ